MFFKPAIHTSNTLRNGFLIDSLLISFTEFFMIESETFEIIIPGDLCINKYYSIIVVY